MIHLSLIRELVPISGLLMLAQLPTPTGSELSNWFVCAAAAVFAIERAMSFWKMLSGEPAKRQVVPGATYVTVPVCEKAMEDSDRRFDDGERRMTSLTNLINETRKELNERINFVGDRVSEAIGEIRRITKP